MGGTGTKVERSISSRLPHRHLHRGHLHLAGTIGHWTYRILTDRWYDLRVCIGVHVAGHVGEQVAGALLGSLCGSVARSVRRLVLVQQSLQTTTLKNNYRTGDK